MTKQSFDIPIALFLFKRSDTVLKIISRIREVKPTKMYLIGDGPRNEDEEVIINNARNQIIQSIDWPCNIITNFAEKNRGVYKNIAGGAKWVFEKEEMAIFLEDDNLPEVSFFSYCEELLNKYKLDEQILWICGTNYLEKYMTKNDESYVFTHNLLPCGWASWSHKFNKYYDGDLLCFHDPSYVEKIKKTYFLKSLCKQQLNSANYEIYRRNKGMSYASWDFQMAISIRYNGLFGISPKNNLIENIGVDGISTHGGNSFQNEMTRRFCGIKSYPLDSKLIHPKRIEIDPVYEREVEKIILFPFKMRLKEKVATFIKRIFGLNKFDKFTIENIRGKHNVK